MFLNVYVDSIVTNAAYEGANEVLKYSNYGYIFTQAKVGKIVYESDHFIVEFLNSETIFTVQIGMQGQLQQIKIR